MADLITLDEFKQGIGKPAGAVTPQDAAYGQYITFASDAVRNYAERDFLTPPVTEARTFDWDASGYVDIDDAQAVTAVTLVTPNAPDVALEADWWAAGPSRRPEVAVYDYVEVYSGAWPASPEMGFTRNIDVMAREGRFPLVRTRVRVDATWGWTAIPGDVKQATIWTAMAFKENPSPYISESIEGYSRTIGPAPREALPERAQALLSKYARLKV